jgi:hypothetical protein
MAGDSIPFDKLSEPEQEKLMTQESKQEQLEQPKLKLVPDDPESVPIPKPDEFNLDAFKSDFSETLAGGVETLQTGLPHHSISEARDFVRLHPDEANFWSAELCFVNVPILGSKRDTMHLIAKPISKLLPPAKVKHFRLALASKPHNAFFLCHVPTRNWDNTWVSSNLDACEKAKTLWTQAISQKEEGVEAYKITFARDDDAFADPKWPTQPINELVHRTFSGRKIMDTSHPGLARLIGAKPIVS